jgi:beta-lactamase class A
VKDEAGRLARINAGAAKKKEAARRKKHAWSRLEARVARELKGLNGVAGVVIKDLGGAGEIGINEDLRIPSASMVKIPVMMAYYYAAKEGKADLASKITVTNADKAPGSGTIKYDIPGKEYPIEELIERMVTESDNTAANMLISHMGVAALNGYFSKMGLKDTNLSRKMMDFSRRKAGVENYTTASDIAGLLERLYRGKFLSAGISKRCMDVLSRQKMKDRIPKRLPGGVAVAHKTGLENGLCHDAGVVYTDNGDFLVCVLTRHRNKNAREAKTVIAEIALLAYNCYEEGGKGSGNDYE